MSLRISPKAECDSSLLVQFGNWQLVLKAMISVVNLIIKLQTFQAE